MNSCSISQLPLLGGTYFEPAFIVVQSRFHDPSRNDKFRRAHATSALIEVGFHDNVLDAEWIVQSTSVIAGALYRGICDYHGYDYRALAGVVPVVVPEDDRDIYLSVRDLQSKLEELVKQIQTMGYACQVLPLA